MINELAPNAPNRENRPIWCAAGTPPHVPAGTRRTHFILKLEESRSSIAIILARNVCAWHFRDVARCDVTNRFLNGCAAWLSLAIDFPPKTENRTICYSPRNRLWRSTQGSADSCGPLSPARIWPFLFPTSLPLSRQVIFICHFTLVISHSPTMPKKNKRKQGGGSSPPPNKAKTSAVHPAPFAAVGAAKDVAAAVAAACTAAESPQAKSTSIQLPAATSTASTPAAALIKSTTDNGPPSAADATVAAAATPCSSFGSSSNVTTSANALGPSDDSLSHALAAATDNYCARSATDVAPAVSYSTLPPLTKNRRLSSSPSPMTRPLTSRLPQSWGNDLLQSGEPCFCNC